jgi:hypothetical protein
MGRGKVFLPVFQAKQRCTVHLADSIGVNVHDRSIMGGCHKVDYGRQHDANLHILFVLSVTIQMNTHLLQGIFDAFVGIHGGGFGHHLFLSFNNVKQKRKLGFLLFQE